MPQDAKATAEAELLELRVLDGPNRFFTSPAVKIEFSAATPGTADAAAARAGEVIRRLHQALELPAPRLARRRSVDERRAVVAFPWRRRAIAQSIGGAASRIALGVSAERRELRSLRAVALGPRPALPRPRIPIVAITGTNGKSTTTRLVAHIAEAAGLRVGMTNSDGIYHRGRLLEAGDWTGYGGAGRVLAQPDLDLAVLETARGGILLRGIGYAHNDVSAVTNVSADHLGLQGIDTLDELADVKAAIVRITRRGGWAVLNGQDERVWAMRHQTRAGWYAFSLDPEAPAVVEALDAGGRAAVLDSGRLVLHGAGRRPVRVVRVEEVPVTFAGRSTHNVANALAATAVADALGIPVTQIAAGLRSFGREGAMNPGRLNLYERRGVLVLIDFAHNEAGLAGLLEVSRALVGPRGRLRLALGTAGDRTDEILRAMGRAAGRAVDELVIGEKPHYLRGRHLDEMNVLMRAGAAEGGYRDEVVAYPTEVTALAGLVEHARRGDVLAIMCHAERQEVAAWLADERFKPVAPERAAELIGSGGD